jgi:hypothetical protein
VIPAVQSASAANEVGKVYINGNTLTTVGGEQKILNATSDANLIRIASDAPAGVGAPGNTRGWSKVASLRVDGSNVIQELITTMPGSQNQAMNPKQLNNFLLSARIVSIASEGTSAIFDITCNENQLVPANASWTTVTIPRGVTLRILTPTRANNPSIRFNGFITLVIDGTVESQSNTATLRCIDTVTIKRGNRTGKGPTPFSQSQPGITGSAFMSYVNSL